MDMNHVVILSLRDFYFGVRSSEKLSPGSMKGDQTGVGYHFLREEEKEKRRGGRLTAVLCLWFWIGRIDVNTKFVTRNASTSHHQTSDESYTQTEIHLNEI
jgi:hypothetical protein